MDLTGLEIQVVVVRFRLIGLALGFLAPSGAKAKARSNLAIELPFFWGVMFLSDKKSDMFPGTQKKTPSNSGTTICLDK